MNLDPDRLVPTEAVQEIFDLYVPLPESARPILSDHPAIDVARLVREVGFAIDEVQSPVPAPIGADPSLLWSRLRVSIHAVNTAGILGLLTSLGRRLDPDAPDLASAGHSVSAETAPTTTFVLDDSSMPIMVPVTASQLCPVGHKISAMPGRQPGRDWMLLAVTAYSRPGLGPLILEAVGRLRPGLQVTGIATALLHGTAVVFALGHHPGGQNDHQREVFQQRLEQEFEEDRLAVIMDGWQAHTDRGGPDEAGERLMLRLHLNVRDRQGMLARVMDTLEEGIAELAAAERPADHLPGLDPASQETARIDVWYALLRVVEGGIATFSATLRLPEAYEHVGDWYGPHWSELERRVRRVLRYVPVSAQTASADRPSIPPDDAVVTLRRIDGDSTGVRALIELKVDPAPGL